MSNVTPILQKIEKKQLRTAAGKQPHPEFRVGDTLRVGVLIKEGEKEREQAFEGVVIARTNNGARASFTVRKVSYGVGVERVFPLHSPRVAKIEVTARGRVRRGRLFYLRDLAGKAARIKARSGIAAALVVGGGEAADAQSTQSQANNP
jgi:large subunit ribosomal protein L19